MKPRTTSFLLKLPLLLLVGSSAIAGFYVKITGMMELSWASPIILSIILISYFIGYYIDNQMIKELSKLQEDKK
jgi:hypothetical protein